MSGQVNIFELLPGDLEIKILDIGAMAIRDEKASYHRLLEYGGTELIGFEPDAEQCAILNNQAGKRQRYFPHFIGDGSRRKFHVTNTRMTSSLYEPNMELLSKFTNLANLVQTVAVEEVETKRLDDLRDSISDIDFLKIDVQGASLDVFRGGVELLKTAVMIQTEVEFVPLYKDQPLFSDVDQFLRSQGFSFVRFSGLCGRCYAPFHINNNFWEPMCQVMWTDAVYMRDFMELDGVSPNKLLRLAAILHTNFQYYDLTHYVLQAYDKQTGEGVAGRYMKKLLP